MATRMQQRKGTAAQWTAADPILNAGEIGWESDTNKFKIGDGTNHWDDLTYFLDATDTGFNSADYIAVTQKGVANGVAALDANVNLLTTTGVVFEGATADAHETTLVVTDPTEDRTITLPNANGTVVLADGSGNVTVSGNLTVSGTTTTINSTTINATTGIVFEGPTANDFETTLAIDDPTEDRTITLPNASGYVVLRDTNETLTNKTFTSPTISGLTLSDSSIIFEGSTANDFETTLQVTDPTADRVITIPNVNGTIITTGNLSDITDIGVFSSTIKMEGATADDYELTLSAGNPTEDREITFPNASGTVITTGNLSDITATGIFSGQIILEGTTPNEFETTVQAQDPTADRTITLPDVSGTVITTGNLSDITAVGVLTTSVVFEGSTADDYELTLGAGNPTSDITISFPDAAGTLVVDTATQTLTNKTLTSPLVSNLQITDGSIVLEGSTPNDFETTLTVTDPTADRTITIPDASGTIAFTTDITVSATSTNTFSNKSISLATNTVSGTTAEFNTALSDSNFVTIGDTGTVTSTMIADGTIVDGDINASAAIAQSKISGLTTDLAAKAPLADPTFTGTVSAANLTLSGDLTVSGTTTNINTTNLVVEDKNIVLGDVTSPTDTTADGGGITLKGATDKTFNWVDATDAWTSSEHINLASGKSLYLNGTLLKDVAETLTNKTLTAPKINLGLNAQTGTTYTLVLGDAGKVVTASNASAITVTVPPSGDVAYATGSQITVLQKGAGQVTFAEGSGVTIRSTGATATAPKLRAQYSSATCVYEGSDVWYVVGDIS